MAIKKKKEAVKTGESRLRDYEVVCIVNPEVADEPLEATINGISQFIIGKGGSVSGVERWGKRRLAYPIKRFLEGNYVLTRFKLDPVWSKELEANLRISEPIVRYLLIEVDARLALKLAKKAESKADNAAKSPAADEMENKAEPSPEAAG